ncbi:hypothetical protein Tco_1529539 [Tanacetum coccineum]
MKEAISPVFQSSLFSFGYLYVLTIASDQFFSVSGKSFGGMTQSGLGISGVSSSGEGFNKSGLVLIFGRWAALVSSDSKRCISSCIGSSLTGCSAGEVGFCLEELEGASLVFLLLVKASTSLV